MKKSLSFIENLFYYLSVILTMGGTFTMKVIIKKAIIEGQE